MAITDVPETDVQTKLVKQVADEFRWYPERSTERSRRRLVEGQHAVEAADWAASQLSLF
jgi:hypothetical protein